MTSRLALLLVLASAPLAHAEPSAIHLIVTGDVDAAAVRSSIASELGRSVERADDRCVSPCLTVVVGGATATIVFSTANGASRQRTVELGTDRRQWPVVITLLAGNLVRDEAADVLALVPEPPSAPAPQGPVTDPETVAVPDPPNPPEPAAPEAPVAEAPVAPEAPPAVVVIRGPHHHAVEHFDLRPLEVGLVPVISTDLTSFDHTRHLLSIDLIVGVSGGASGLAIAGLVDVATDHSWGFQVAGIAAITGHLQGVQVAGIGTIADDVDGIQLGGIAAIGDRVEGAQVAGIATVADRADTQVAGIAAIGDHASVQVAGVATVSDGRAGLQIGGVAAIAEDVNLQIAGVVGVADHDAHVQIAGVAAVADDANLQIAGAVNVANTANVQIAGAVNVADRLTGLQIAPINVASRVDGIQLGVINIGGSADGDSFGLINIIPGGRYDLEAAVDSSRIGTLLFRHGGRHWHNVYGVGGHQVDATMTGQTGSSNDVWMYGAGFGPTWRLGQTVVDLEALAWEVNHGASHERDLSLLAQLRLSVAFGIHGLSLVAGATLDTYISNDRSSPLLIERTTGTPATMPTGVVTTVWPSLFAGVRL